MAAEEPGNGLSKSRGDVTVKIDDVAKVMAAGAHANVKYTNSGAGRNENDGQSIMKRKRKYDSALCLGKVDVSGRAIVDRRDEVCWCCKMWVYRVTNYISVVSALKALFQWKV